MARRPRSDDPGSWHHVLNRGIAKRALFETRDDARYFLSRLARQVRAGRIEVHAYCLMTTHFHLLVRSPVGQMSEAMRQVQNSHSRRFNRSRRRDGALIRGRFTSRVVRSLEYRRTLVRYIDLNPVRAGVVRAGESYELGSARAYLGGRRPPWLCRDWVEDEVRRAVGASSFTPAAYRRAFPSGQDLAVCELVEARIDRPAGADPLDSLVLRATADVRAWMQRKARLADGCRVGVPSCGQSALQGALEAEVPSESTWYVEQGRKVLRGSDVAWCGLLHDLGGATWEEVGRSRSLSESAARRLGRAHRRLLEEDEAYADRVARIARAALRHSLLC